MAKGKTILMVVLVLGAAVGGLVLVQSRTVQAQEGAATMHKEFVGKKVEIYYREQEARHTGFECIFCFDATVKSVTDEGMFAHTTKKWIRNTYWAGENDIRVEDSVGKEYKHYLFIPWEAVRYVKIVK